MSDGSGDGVGDQLTSGDDPEVVDLDALDHDIQSYDRRYLAHWQESRYASPMPSPADLREYQELVPDAAERLMAAGERE